MWRRTDDCCSQSPPARHRASRISFTSSPTGSSNYAACRPHDDSVRFCQNYGHGGPVAGSTDVELSPGGEGRHHSPEGQRQHGPPAHRRPAAWIHPLHLRCRIRSAAPLVARWAPHVVADEALPHHHGHLQLYAASGEMNLDSPLRAPVCVAIVLRLR